MATVRISHQLQYQIDNKVRDIFSKAEQAIHDKVIPHTELLFNFFIPPENQAFMDKLPENYFKSAEELNFYFISSGCSSFYGNLKFHTARKIPYEFNRDASTTTIDLDKINNEKIKEIFIPIVKEWADVQTHFTQMREQIRQLMNENKTVGLCIAAWPHFYELLPEATKKMHDSKVTREARVKTVLDSEVITNMNVSLMKHKIGG